jgi:regulator of protease activity HflC (stomatin/prohibitin superfamily)
MPEIMDFIEYISKGVMALLVIYVLYQFLRSIRLVPQQQAFIVERLGNYHRTLEAGFHTLIPFIDRVPYKRDLREQTIEVPPQDCFTEDNVKVKVDGVIYLSVMDPVNASYGVTDYRYAATQLAQTTTRSVIGQMDLDQTFQERTVISQTVVGVLAEIEQTWGIKVHRYEIKNIDPPRTVQNAMERQMTAERERRALIARSEGQEGSTVNDGKGEKAEMINKSEGEMQRRINEAEGRAKEIEALANATARAIEEIAAAVSAPGGEEAIKLQLAERYLKEIGRLGKSSNRILLPANLTSFDDVLQGLGLDEMTLTRNEQPAARTASPSRSSRGDGE